MLPVFVEPSHGFNLGAEMESLKAELRGRLQRLVNTSESVSKSLFARPSRKRKTPFSCPHLLIPHGKSFVGLLNGFCNPEKAFSMGFQQLGCIRAEHVVGFTQLPFR